MTLAERIHVRMVNDRHVRSRLYGINPAAVEEVIRLAVEALSEMVPAETLASEVAVIDFEACEACGHLVDPANPEGAVYGCEDGIWLCDACAVEAKDAEP